MTLAPPTDTALMVRTLRQHYGLTQGELAVLLDVTRQTVTNWERGSALSRMQRYALRYLDLRLAEHPEDFE
jgi:DNA-binding transcriptional regulator YiaG